MPDDVTSILPSIKVHHFPPIISLGVDGMRLPQNTENMIVRRKALLECPTCLGIDDFYNCEKVHHYDSMHCPGGQPPEVECAGPLGLGKHTHQVACAGVNEAHFHVKCRCCDTIFFLGMPEKSNGKSHNS